MAIVQCGVVERADAAGRVVLLDGFDELGNGKLQLAGQIFQRVGFSARKHRRHEPAEGLLVDDRVSLLTGLTRDQAPPDRIPLGPEVFALVIEAFTVAINHHAQRYAIDTGTDTTVIQGRTGVDGHHVRLRRVANEIGAQGLHAPKQYAGIETRPANQKVV
ncbi:hypothetical protein D3C76_1186960 [compost metagenome]